MIVMKLTERKPKNNLTKIAWMIALTVGVQVLTLIKSTIVASSFGTSEGMDAYNFANSLVSFVFGIAVSGISTIIIPEYANKRDKHVVNTFITVIYGGALLATAAMMSFRYPLISLFSNKGESFSTIAANVLVILLVSQYFTTFSGITTAFFQCENKHNVPKIINLLTQVFTIAVLLYLNGRMTVLEYAIIISCGHILCFAIDTLFALRSGWRFKPTLRFDDAGKAILTRFVPIIISSGVYQLSLLIDSMIAANLPTGSITILGYSTQISSIASTIVVGNLLLYIYPKITRSAQISGYQEHFWEQARGLHAIVCLMIAGFACVGKDAVLVLLNRGKFSAEACEIVFCAAAIYIFGQGISIVRDMVYRYFYAVGNTKIPAQNSVLVSVCNISLSLLLVKLIGFYGIVLGTVAASLISLVVIMIRFHNVIGFSCKVFQIAKKFFKNFAIMLLTIVLVYATKQMLPITNHLLSMFVFGIETVIVYVLVQYAINKKALLAIKNL